MSTSVNFIPRVFGLFQILLATGYDLLYSILEYTDNSISKQAKNVKVVLGKESRALNSLIDRIIVYDDGIGMNFMRLMESFVIANTTEEDRDDTDIGKFHVGMKSAAINQGTKISILSKEKDGSLVGLFADITRMCTTNSYEPTVSLEHVDEQFLKTHFNSADIAEFLSYSSGTLIQVTDLRPEFKLPYTDAITSLKVGLQNAYSSLPNQCAIALGNSTERDTKSIEDGYSGFEFIDLNDAFYINSDWKDVLDYPPEETTLIAYRGVEKNDPIELFEKNTSIRIIHGKEKTLGRKAQPVYYRCGIIGYGEAYYKNIKGIVQESDLPDVKRLLGEVRLRTIQVNKKTFDEEANKFKQSDRKGFFFNRNIRCVGSGLRLGEKIHDRSTPWIERIRTSVSFVPKLDKQFDSKFNKQMEDKALTCRIMNETITSFYRQVSTVWNKRSKDQEDAERARLEEDRIRSEKAMALVIARKEVEAERTVQPVQSNQHPAPTVKTFWSPPGEESSISSNETSVSSNSSSEAEEEVSEAPSESEDEAVLIVTPKQEIQPQPIPDGILGSELHSYIQPNIRYTRESLMSLFHGIIPTV
jgi:hypothetical protein